ncbi:methionyl aminopeptidase [Thermosporothrix hazakensis]|jgi:methionyl aminopeptidase|uniref:Methionine aminopeptidase n=2 Tax=Thermosporothrix TaxID=768650 RepID=A0A326U1Y6_THEHA|nr:type I methionyl aminopeptidase [Thermosporothrix hazakensis]PZW23965.1 methionyl aminopeptidase [Thermosporothrix hazakensis]BBH90399.1 methionine aminopeptidase [Thermosporothrix sp. COM3]GCE48436.1 methionine aminopeptidase [Thermosporothrix hazakensis]
MLYLKSDQEIAAMRKAGLVVWHAHQAAAALIQPGITTAEINEAVERSIREQNATPLFKGVPGKVPFPAATCISVNEQIVHGIPGSRRLQEGDIVSIDIGAKLNGWCGDAATTYVVGQVDEKKQKLLEVTEKALKIAIEAIPRCRMWSQVAQRIEDFVHKAGFEVLEGLVGHGIGSEMWEPPQVPNYYTRQYQINGDFPLQPGLVIAIEPMVSYSSRSFQTLPDHWTLATADGSPSAHFEHTVAITRKGPQVLTAGPDGKGWAIS